MISKYLSDALIKHKLKNNHLIKAYKDHWVVVETLPNFNHYLETGKLKPELRAFQLPKPHNPDRTITEVEVTQLYDKDFDFIKLLEKYEHGTYNHMENE